MTQQEKQERVDYLEREIFALDMKDRWDAGDYDHMNEMKAELEELKKDG